MISPPPKSPPKVFYRGAKRLSPYCLLHLVFFPPHWVTCVVPRRVAQAVGVPEPPGLSMNFGTLNHGKPDNDDSDVLETGIGARRPGDRIAPEDLLGVP